MGKPVSLMSPPWEKSEDSKDVLSSEEPQVKYLNELQKKKLLALLNGLIKSHSWPLTQLYRALGFSYDVRSRLVPDTQVLEIEPFEKFAEVLGLDFDELLSLLKKGKKEILILRKKAAKVFDWRDRNGKKMK